MNIINLTPHAIVVVVGDATTTFAPSGSVARCAAVSAPAGFFYIGDIEVPLTNTAFGDVVGLPDAAPDTIYIVSALVRSAVPSRHDVASPGEPVRDAGGNVLGCRCLIINA